VKQRGLIKTKSQNKKQKIETRLSIVNQGEAIGMIDVINYRAYTASLKCVSGAGVCYAIQALEFF
jgi:hypothetical protein